MCVVSAGVAQGRRFSCRRGKGTGQRPWGPEPGSWSELNCLLAHCKELTSLRTYAPHLQDVILPLAVHPGDCREGERVGEMEGGREGESGEEGTEGAGGS